MPSGHGAYAGELCPSMKQSQIFSFPSFLSKGKEKIYVSEGLLLSEVKRMEA